MADLLSDLDLRVLSHYAAGTELRSIASMLKIDVEDVRDLVATRTGFTRSKAGEIVRRAKGQARSPVAVLDREPPARHVKSEPPPEPVLDPPPAESHSSVDAVLVWAQEAGSRFVRKADRIRLLAAELGRDLEAYEQVLAASRRVEELRRELDKASEELRGLRGTYAAGGRSPVPPAQIKAWAAQAGIPCNSHGQVPKRVREKYYAAHPGSEAA